MIASGLLRARSNMCCFGGVCPSDDVHKAIRIAGRKVFRLDSDLCANASEFGHKYIFYSMMRATTS
jgi:hypothetical protein